MHESVKPAFKRLFDAKSLWHRAGREYFEPNSFRMAINSCIQELRNVTFVLQANKRGIEGFDNWYQPWQEKMRVNQSLKWLVSARNYIVKQGDLDLNSVLRIEVIGSYLAGEIRIFEQDYEPNLTNKEIFEKTITLGLPEQVFKNSYVKLERRWVDVNHPDHELLDLLSICWASVAELLLDAPGKNTEDTEKLRTSRLPPCMHKDSETRSIWMKVVGGTLMPTEMHVEQVNIGESEKNKVLKRYADSPLLREEQDLKTFSQSNLKSQCERLFENAKYVLKKDGYHVHLVMIFVDSELAQVIELRNNDQADKYRTIRSVASQMEKIGANQFVMISEMWTARFDAGQPYRKASEAPGRGEMLTLIAASQAGEGYLFSIPFTRKGESIEYGKHLVQGSEGIKGINIIQPLLSIWQK